MSGALQPLLTPQRKYYRLPWLCGRSRKTLMTTKRLHLMNHQVMGMWWTCISAHKKFQRQTPRSNPKSKMIITILGIKGLPLHLGKHKKNETTDEEGWSTDHPKVENTKQVWEDSGGQEYIHEKQAKKHSARWHEHPFYPGHLGQSTTFGLQHCWWDEEKSSEHQFVRVN